MVGAVDDQAGRDDGPLRPTGRAGVGHELRRGGRWGVQHEPGRRPVERRCGLHMHGVIATGNLGTEKRPDAVRADVLAQVAPGRFVVHQASEEEVVVDGDDGGHAGVHRTGPLVDGGEFVRIVREYLWSLYGLVDQPEPVVAQVYAFSVGQPLLEAERGGAEESPPSIVSRAQLTSEQDIGERGGGACGIRNLRVSHSRES